MTEIRIYEDHNKVVLCFETHNMYDKLSSVAYEPSCQMEWHDDDWTYFRMPLDDFMDYVKKCVNEKPDI